MARTAAQCFSSCGNSPLLPASQARSNNASGVRLLPMRLGLEPQTCYILQETEPYGEEERYVLVLWPSFAWLCASSMSIIRLTVLPLVKEKTYTEFG